MKKTGSAYEAEMTLAEGKAARKRTARRPGKTAKDKRTGAWSNRFDNRQKRATWGQNAASSQATFPYETCNGQKNRYWVVRRGERRHVVIREAMK